MPCQGPCLGASPRPAGFTNGSSFTWRRSSCCLLGVSTLQSICVRPAGSQAKPCLAARRSPLRAASSGPQDHCSHTASSTDHQTSASQQGSPFSGRNKHYQQHQAAQPNPAAMTAATQWASQGRIGSLFPAFALGVMLTLAFQSLFRWVYQQLVDIGGVWTTRALYFLDGGKTNGSGGATAPPGNSASSGAVNGEQGMRLALPAGVTDATSLLDQMNQGESVEWVNMCIRKAWRVYLRGLERWIADLIQPVFDSLVQDGAVPRFVQRLRVVELTLDHEAPYFTNMRRRNSRKDSDLTGVVDLRYTGGARMLMMLEIGAGRWRFKVPVLVSDLDLECQMWIKIRLAPVCPWIGTLSLAFVGPPNVKVQLSPYNRVRLMRIPVVQSFLRQLFTVDLPALMVLPKRLEINIPPSVTSIAEAAVGRDVIMRAVASAVLQADAREQALLAALPLGPQTPAGGVSLPESFKGELDVVLVKARNLPVWGFPGQSNPYCRLILGEQAVQSRRDDDTSLPGKHRHPTWNQEFQFLVEDPQTQTLEVHVRDSQVTGRVAVGSATLPLSCLPLKGGKASLWLPLKPAPPPGAEVIKSGITRAVPHAGNEGSSSMGSHSPAAATPMQGTGKQYRAWADVLGLHTEKQGEVLLEMTYKAFEDGEADCGDAEADAFQAALQKLGHTSEERITDVRSAAAASSRAAVAASAAISAIAMTRAAAARAAAKAARAAQSAAAAAAEQAAVVANVAAGGVRDTLGGGSDGNSSNNNADSSMEQSSSSSSSSSSRSGGSDGKGAKVAQGVLEVSVPEASIKEGSSSEEDGESWGREGGGSFAESSNDGEGGGLGALRESGGTDLHVGIASAQEADLNSNDHGAEAVSSAHELQELDSNSKTVFIPPGKNEDLHFQQHLHARNTAGVHKAGGGGGASQQQPTGDLGEGHPLSNWLMDESQRALVGVGASQVQQQQAPVEVCAVGATDAEQLLGRQQQQHKKRRAGGQGMGAAGTDVMVDQQQRHDRGVGEQSIDATLAQRGSQGEQGHHRGSRRQQGHIDSHQHLLPASVQQPLASRSQNSSESPSEVSNGVVDKREGGSGRAVAKQQDVEGGNSSEGEGTQRDQWWSALFVSVAMLLPKSAPDSAAQTDSSKESNARQVQQERQQQQEKPWWESLQLPGYGPQPSSDIGQQKGNSASPPSPPPSSDPALKPDTEPESSKPWWAFWEQDKEEDAAAKASKKGGKQDGNNAENEEREGAKDEPKEGEKPWWMFWVKEEGGENKEAGVSASNSSRTEVSKDGAQPDEQERGRPWWQFWKGGDEDQRAEGQGTRYPDDKAVDAIIIPPDLPLEDIAEEVARLKQETWRLKEGHVESLWARTVERNDRKWVVLAVFLLTVSVGLLATVAYRLDKMSREGGPENFEATLPLLFLQLWFDIATLIKQ